MPPKRKLDDAENAGAVPRTPKKARTIVNGTPKSSARRGSQRSSAAAKVTDIYSFDEAVESNARTASIDQDDEEEEDDLTQTKSPRKRQSGAPVLIKDSAKKATPRKVKSINDTPTKSTARRRRSNAKQSLGPKDDDAGDDPAANLILRLAGEEEEDAHFTDEDDHDEGEQEEEEDEGQAKEATNGITLHGGFEAYFDQVSRKQKTSNNTLSKMPALSRAEYLAIIQAYQLPYQDAIDALYDSHVRAFREWSFELDQNYSICLTGYGSKKTLIESFCAREAKEFGDAYIIINGYHPNIDLRQICAAITAGLDKTGSDVDATLEALDEMDHERLILALHNIDGSNLRSEKVQSQLARLVGHARVRMICSIDHVNAPLLFSASRANELHLLYHDATTFMPYTLETELQQDTLSSATKTALVGDRGIKWILQTLSQNARTIFRILLLEQMETGQGMESARLYERASAAFAVSNKTSYNAQLGEFLDHEIIVRERGGGGGGESNAEVLRIPFDKAELQRLLEDIDAGDASDDD